MTVGLMKIFPKGESQCQQFTKEQKVEDNVCRKAIFGEAPHWTCLRRVHVAVLVFFGLITNFMLRVNIMYAIEYMNM